jgi:CBS domain-containing protein
VKVKELMSTDVQSCTPETDLATVARMMWDGDCGIIPVVDDQRRVAGVITDRDICIAAATRSLDPARIRVSEAMTRDVTTCVEDADARSALQALKEHRVRRLPVVNRQDRLVGVLSINDLVRQADCRQGTGVPGEEFLETLQVICAHPMPVAGARS